MYVPCELMVLHVLPRIRALVAEELVNARGVSQVRVAEILGITQPAVSQYLRKARSKSVRALEDDPKIGRELSRIAMIAADGKDISTDVCRLCHKLRTSKALCSLHRSVAVVPKACSFCKGR